MGAKIKMTINPNGGINLAMASFKDCKTSTKEVLAATNLDATSISYTDEAVAETVVVRESVPVKS